MSDHTQAHPEPPASGVVLAASFLTPSPALPERCLAAMQAFVARAGGGPVDGVASGVEQGVIACFDDTLGAARCAVRASVEIRKLSAQQADRNTLALKIGLCGFCV